MSTSFPTELDASSLVGDATAAIERRLGVTDSTDPNSVTYQMSLIQPQLPHRTGGDKFVHGPVGACAGSDMLTVNLIYAYPFPVPTTADYSAAGVIRTASLTGYERLGAYEDAGGVPGDLIADWGTNSTASGGVGFKGITFPNVSELTAGFVWLACCPQEVSNTIWSTVGTASGAPMILGTTAPSATGMTMGYSGASTTAGLPDAWGSTYTECSTVPVVWVARA